MFARTALTVFGLGLDIAVVDRVRRQCTFVDKARLIEFPQSHRRQDPPGQGRCASQGMRTAARSAHDRKFIDAHQVGDLATSAAADATSRPGCGVDQPYPGRSCETQRMPRSAAAANSGSGGAPVLGVP